MNAIKQVRGRFSSTARVGHALAGAVLLVLPAIVVHRDGSAGVTAGLILSGLSGIAYLVAAAAGGAISDDLGGPV